MIRIRRATEHFHADHGWLESFHHFSFNDFYDPDNISWATLRVVNEDVIHPSEGFPFHYHENMEIVTYVMEGELTHEDSLGNKGVIKPGVVQRMSAGTGIQHAEYNASPSHPVHLLQMWVVPQKSGLPASWEEKTIDLNAMINKPLVVAHPSGKENTLTIHQDASFWVSKIEKGKTIRVPSEYSHQYMIVIEGEVTLNGKSMHAHDAARMEGEKTLSVLAQSDSHVVGWDLNEVKP